MTHHVDHFAACAGMTCPSTAIHARFKQLSQMAAGCQVPDWAKEAV